VSASILEVEGVPQDVVTVDCVNGILVLPAPTAHFENDGDAVRRQSFGKRLHKIKIALDAVVVGTKDAEARNSDSRIQLPPFRFEVTTLAPTSLRAGKGRV
jgi:hypothetical protein